MKRHVVVVVAALAFVACTGDDPAPPPSAVDGGTDGGGGGANVRCSATTPCATGVCVDGFCCDQACTGTCEACDVAGSEGKCTAVTGAPHHAKCDGDATGTCAGACDGTNRASCTYPTSACGTGSCAAGVATLAPTCKNGTCPAATTQMCALGCFQDGCLGVTQLAAGYSHACAVLSDKKLRCWGSNTAGGVLTGQIGQGTGDANVKYTTPREVPGLVNVEQVAATFGSTCARFTDGTVKCWGSNTSGELGQGGAMDSNEHAAPLAVASLSGVSFISGSSDGHYCAIVTGGQLRCWGANATGQLGAGTTTAVESTPVTVCAPGSTALPCSPATGAVFVKGGDDHTCAIFAGGQVACWGANNDGQLGLTPNGVAHPFPANVPGLTGATYLTAGNQTTCAVVGGGAKCWGSPGGGLVGNGTDGASTFPPVDVCTAMDCSTKLGGVTGVSTFDVSTCALAGGAVKCWGDNRGGQLGDGNATLMQSFAGSTAVATGAVEVWSGGQTNYAVVVDGANRDVRCWGADGYGECGDGTGSGNTHYTPVSPQW